MEDSNLRQIMLEIEEIKLKAQLRAVRAALRGEKEPTAEDGKQSLSQVSYVYELLKEAECPLHVSEIISRCKQSFGIELQRESIVSALLKKVKRLDRFTKVGPNVFGLIEDKELYLLEDKEG
ncbi:MAG: hypothetical protein LHW64_07365 [Candidatus Cloacimonetes bacterium]|jgi:hypothetical protein|nr:hypothetical protein [Candidatus Cloacimonadota bacterium]MCB5287607.1 hypothetical protein [Candidatus Cloacimonadota bacterium]MCK9185663.1 hypothetical protein [Candidatus Cloacimonadota bacterium]MCK9584765.1 hypothetical protein [Candidatus Cloacimonadota bacterium]MDY0229929.1 hypothetical protein [Candidatus Cloacimonadaceae bacterium]